MWIIEAKYGKDDFYPKLEKEILSLIDGEKNLIANLSNISSWIYHTIPNLNWCGFYLWDNTDQELILGPFQGKPACIRIKPHRGVCGASYTQKKTLRISDVHEFQGHIACDSDTNSELVIPLMKGDTVLGVLDLDSPLKSNFTQEDETKLSNLMNRVSELIF
jgi:L-methionine (R)-S-oxide reductase